MEMYHLFCFASLDAARVRKEYDESSDKLSKIQSRISSLTQKLKHDFGLYKMNLCLLIDALAFNSLSWLL